VSLWRQLTRGLRVLTRRAAADAELDRELQHYLDEATDAHVARGLSLGDARRAARREVGSATAVREVVRDHGWEHLVTTLLADLRLAGRMLRRSPVFTLVVVAVVALGSGAVTTIFSGMNAIVLRPVPGIADLERLVTLRPVRQNGDASEQGWYALHAYLRERSRTLDETVAWGRVSLTISARGEGTAVFGNMVSGNYFQALGVQPALGRFFAADEDRTPLAHPVVVISHAFWTSRMGGDPAAVGSTVLVNGNPFTIIGVAPDDFRGVYTGLRADAWVPLMMQPQLRPRSNLTTASWLWLFGRLRDGTNAGAAQQELAALADAYRRDSGEAVRPTSLQSIRVAGMTGLPNGEGSPLFMFMGVLLGAASLVLVIAGVNVAAMLSARYAARRSEMAVRAALGAGRVRLVRLLLTEILALFLLGALGGFGLAQVATTALERLPLPDNIPVVLELSPDFRVLAFAVIVSLITGVVFGLAPALRAAGSDITSRLRDDSAGGGHRRTFMSRALIVGQLALSLVLLVAAGLFMRALNRGERIDPGFEMTGVITASLEPESWGYNEAKARAFYRALRERLEGTAGVTSVSYTGRLPLMMSSSIDELARDGMELPVHTATVDADYFAVLRLPLIQGREFHRTDDERAARVVVINETLARKLWPDGAAVGRTIRLRTNVHTVVGVARDAKYATLDEATPPFVYMPVAQSWQPSQTLLARTAGDPQAFASRIQDAVRSLDPQLPRPRTTTLRRATALVLLPQRTAAIVTGALGAVGLLLAAVGLYGIMAFSTGRRAREIGIRVALGAARSNVLRMVVREGMQLAALGIGLGLLLASVATRVLARWLFDVSPLDGATFALMSLIFVAVALVATYLPARRAANSDPIKVLRF
jgi:predicted permease